jgi:hypothetical protein
MAWRVVLHDFLPSWGLTSEVLVLQRALPQAEDEQTSEE